MRRLLIVFFLLSGPAYAQDDLAQEVAALRQLVESQNRLLADQSAQLRQLSDRVTELEGESLVTETDASDLIVMETDPGLARQSEAPDARTEALDAEEIGLQTRQTLRTGREAVIVDEPVALSDTLDLYGSMRIFAEMGDDNPTLNDGSSRFGLNAARELPTGHTVFGRIEWRTNLVNNNSRFVVGDSASEGTPLERAAGSSALTTRLGYLGMRFDNIGELTFGKQWSVYYDVAGWTDAFNVYGGTALSVYSGGTDGGPLGSGRADSAIIWRNSRGVISYGLQAQLKTTDDFNDYAGFGGSLIIAPSDSWEIGASFTGSRIDGVFETITGTDDAGVANVGVRYRSGPWHVAFNVATWQLHEAIFFVDDTLFYDGVGSELYVNYKFSDRLQIYGGFNYTDPDIDDPRVDSDFGTEQLLLGFSWFATEESFAYVEALLQGGTNVIGERSESVLAAGYRFDF